MDRRDFIKASILGAAVTMTGCSSDILKGSQEHPNVRIEGDGWLKRPAREIPVIADAEVVVLGGGPAGV
jgi:hypothetical protein